MHFYNFANMYHSEDHKKPTFIRFSTLCIYTCIRLCTCHSSNSVQCHVPVIFPIYGYQNCGNTMLDLVETFDGSNRILQSEYIICTDNHQKYCWGTTSLSVSIRNPQKRKGTFHYLESYLFFRNCPLVHLRMTTNFLVPLFIVPLKVILHIK